MDINAKTIKQGSPQHRQPVDERAMLTDRATLNKSVDPNPKVGKVKVAKGD